MSKLITSDDLEKGLLAMAPLVAEKTIASQFVNGLVHQFLHQELSKKFFSIEPEEWRRIASLLNSPRVGNDPALPGEEKVDDYLSNRHEEWVEPLMKKLEAGGIFIAVGAAHVIAGFDPNVREPLLETFKKRGLTVTPVLSCSQIVTPR